MWVAWQPGTCIGPAAGSPLASGAATALGASGRRRRRRLAFQQRTRLPPPGLCCPAELCTGGLAGRAASRLTTGLGRVLLPPKCRQSSPWSSLQVAADAPLCWFAHKQANGACATLVDLLTRWRRPPRPHPQVIGWSHRVVVRCPTRLSTPARPCATLPHDRPPPLSLVSLLAALLALVGLGATRGALRIAPASLPAPARRRAMPGSAAAAASCEQTLVVWDFDWQVDGSGGLGLCVGKARRCLQSSACTRKDWAPVGGLPCTAQRARRRSSCRRPCRPARDRPPQVHDRGKLR